MKRYLIAAIAAFLLTACSSSPDTVVRDFYNYLDNGKPVKAAELISPQSRAMWGGKVDAALVDFSERIAKCDGIEHLEVVQTAERGDLRAFKVTMTLKSKDRKCGVKVDSIKTINADGKWLIILG